MTLTQRLYCKMIALIIMLILTGAGAWYCFHRFFVLFKEVNG